MKKILFINACVRPGSRTYLLAREVLKRLDGKTEEVKLCDENIRPLDWEQLEKRDRLIMQKIFRTHYLNTQTSLQKQTRSLLQHLAGIWLFRLFCGCILSI